MYQLRCKFPCRQLIHSHVFSNVNHHLIDGIHMYVLRRNVSKIYLIYPCAVFHIVRHPRRCRNIPNLKTWVFLKLRCKYGFTCKMSAASQPARPVPVDLAYPLYNLKKPCSPRYPISLQGWRDSKAYCLFSPACISHNKIRCQRVKSTLSALY